VLASGRGDECGGRGGGAVREVELLHEEVRAHVVEGGEGPSAPEMQAEGGVAVVEAADHVQDESPVGDMFAQIP